MAELTLFLTKINLLVCMCLWYVCVWCVLHTCECVSVYAHVYICRSQRSMLVSFFLSLSLISLSQGLSLSWKLCFIETGCLSSCLDHPSLLHSAGITAHIAWVFTWVLRFKFRFLGLQGNHPYPLSCLRTPHWRLKNFFYCIYLFLLYMCRWVGVLSTWRSEDNDRK